MVTVVFRVGGYAEKAKLRRLEPVIRELAFLHWKPAVLNNEIENSEASDFHNQLQDGYPKFGGTCLTPREREVVHLMLQGHSRNSASAVMNVSPNTIKEHRKSIYLKLDVSSHAELFALFFEALKHSDGKREDPRANYLVNSLRKRCFLPERVEYHNRSMS